LVCSQCSGALILAKMGFLDGQSVCTDNSTRIKMVDAGYHVMDSAFTSVGNIATAGGCLSAHYLAGWITHQLLGQVAMEKALGYVVPVGEEILYISRVLNVIGAHVTENTALTNHLNPTPKSGAV